MVITNNSNNKYDVYRRIARENIQDYLAHAIVPSYKFYAEDHIDFQTTSSENGMTNHLYLESLSIKTNAIIDFKDGDLILDVKNDLCWRVQDGGVIVADDGTSKKHSLRPRKTTYLSLIRLEQ